MPFEEMWGVDMRHLRKYYSTEGVGGIVDMADTMGIRWK